MFDQTLSIEQRVDALIRGPQYAMRQAEKDVVLTAILGGLCGEIARHCPPYDRFLRRLGSSPAEWKMLSEVPPLPVSMFKQYLLVAVPPEKVVRELLSSSTTGQQPSRILIDKTTAFRQARALASILKEHLGGHRRPFLVLDAQESAAAGDTLTARGAAIRGVGNFASETVYGMKKQASGDLAADWPSIEDFFQRHWQEPVLLFGFTFVVWTRFVEEAERRAVKFQASKAQLLHSGGWKKLADQAVIKEEFTRRTSDVLGCDPRGILDFYGMVEQVGTVFVDCQSGNKHAPAFADVLIRRPYTLEPAAIGQTGIIEVISVLPTSYPGQALITEDQGVLMGVDDCPCGRSGNYFRFTKRIEQAEARGCGDTFAQAREIR
ncbi:MAG: acyl-protein synthetase [Thermoguttaceae bacterium]|jgi:phenylacetate-coenzyme A ligase PaaK-like adenylate-forming protein